ncbi:multidrug effflux MFS transporter [Aestuariivirga litoralis]|uniref:multidrug effflux MFS transporter n=1 Tax=Aestuariivirga litoralis TaxID=2650924 RepID=UPI0018C4A384|nr:multidrug effflux MFS transporter [Aestuariivirga litoralis]MBG1230995.1 multidrug effflux MFS transporter [Aestuariivirga litoralis]
MTVAKVVGRLGRFEFITLVAAMIAINAFAIDVMLPGLQQIGAGLGEADPNRRQLVIPAYMLGFGILQIVFGPLSDRYGRRKPLLVGLVIYCLAALSAYVVTDFNSLVLLRCVQGAGAAASAVIAMALIRDLFVGDEMAKTMSLAFMVMMLSPIFAPIVGQFLLLTLDWRGLFLFMAALGALVSIWVFFRLPETLKPENKRPFGLRPMIEGFGIVFSNFVSLRHIMATALLFGALMGFLTSAQQIYVGIYQVGPWFPAFFGAAGVAAALGGFANSQLVNKYGMRRIAFLALLAFCAISPVLLLLSYLNMLSVWLFLAATAIQFFTFSMVMPNFGSLALEPLGEVAGTAASAQGFLQMVLGAAIGTYIGQQFNDTVIPLAVGQLILALLALALTGVAARRQAVAVPAE